MIRYNASFYSLLCMVTFITSLYCLTPMQRGTIQDLTKKIQAGDISPAEARDQALRLKIPSNQMHDSIVQDLIQSADEKGILHILRPVEQKTKTQHTVSPPPALNPAVQQVYDDFTIFNKSIENFKPGQAYMANSRKLEQFMTEEDRITDIVDNLSKVTLNQKDQATIQDLKDNLLPPLSQKIEKITQEIDDQEINRRTPAAAQIQNVHTIPVQVRELINEYVNRSYTEEQLMQLRRKNLGLDKILNPYTGKTSNEMWEMLTTYNLAWIANPEQKWDLPNMRDTYYLLSLAKRAFKEHHDIKNFQRVNQALVKLLAKNSNESSIVSNFSSDNVPLKNKYFIEYLDAFEKENTK